MTITITKTRLFWLLFLASCATATTPLRLQDRTLLIDPNGPNLIYPYMGEECKNPTRRIFRGCKDKRIIIKYDLTDKITRDKLNAAGFQCSSKLKYSY